MNPLTTDIQHDTTGRLESWVRNNFKVPEWADGMDKTASPELPPSAYAYPEVRLFPVDSKSNTWWSSLAFGRMLGKQEFTDAAMDKVAGNLKTAMAFWGITPSSFEAVTEPEMPKEAGHVFTLNMNINGCPAETVLCTEADEFIKAAGWLVTEGRRRYPYDCRKEAARDMLRDAYASELDDALKIELEKTAGYGAVSRASMTCMLDILSRGLDKLGYAEFKGMLDNTIRKCPDLTVGPDLEKTASVIDSVHRALRVMKKAEGVNLPPLEETLNIQTRTMLEKAGASFVLFPDGRLIDDEEFEKCSERILQYVNTVLHKEATPESLRDVVENLNDAESAEFTEALAALGL